MLQQLRARVATPNDASSLAGIYNLAIEDRTATFETNLRTDEDVIAWFDGRHPIVAVIDDDVGIIGFARTHAYSARDCYSGIFEFGVYTDPNHRRRGVASLGMRELITRARAAGAWKLVSRVFVENEGSRSLLAALGFREVGTYHRHAKLDGQWRDVIIVEKFLAPIAAAAATGASGTANTTDPTIVASRDEILASLRSETLSTRVHALVQAKDLIAAHQFPDADLLVAAADALFVVKVHDSTARSRFVDFFRTYASVSKDSARDLFTALFARLEKLSIALDLDAFYEVAFVVKQVAQQPEQQSALTRYVPQLLEWMRLAIDLPMQGMRTRISPGNVTSLLMNLALAGCATDEQKQDVANLAGEAKARHRVEPPVSLRSSQPPPPLSPGPTVDLVIPPLPIPKMTDHGDDDEDGTKTTAPPPYDASFAVTVEIAAIDMAALEASLRDAKSERPAEVGATTTTTPKKRAARKSKAVGASDVSSPKKKRAPRKKKEKVVPP